MLSTRTLELYERADSAWENASEAMRNDLFSEKLCYFGATRDAAHLPPDVPPGGTMPWRPRQFRKRHFVR